MEAQKKYRLQTQCAPLCGHIRGALNDHGWRVGARPQLFPASLGIHQRGVQSERGCSGWGLVLYKSSLQYTVNHYTLFPLHPPFDESWELPLRARTARGETSLSWAVVFRTISFFVGWAKYHFNNLHLRNSLETKKNTWNGNRQSLISINLWNVSCWNDSITRA